MVSEAPLKSSEAPLMDFDSLPLTSEAPLASASGGIWHGGKMFNGVGEGATPSDFAATFDGEKHSSPLHVARRGLFQEMGFSQGECDAASVAIHSLAWANDILDHKFFGYALTTLTASQVRHRWESARDRSENREIKFFGVSSKRACLDFCGEFTNPELEWSPEATFCTTRSLLVAGKLEIEELIERLRSQRKSVAA